MYIIFGSSGFIGKNLKKHLIKKYGKNNIFCFDRNPSNKNFSTKINLSKKNLVFKSKILKANTAFILSADSRVIVNNVLAKINQIKNKKQIIKNIIKILRQIDISNIVYFNSSSVYSSFNKKPFKENQKLNPKIALGKSKFYAEKKLSEICKRKKINFLSLRIFTVYGPGISKHQFIAQAIKKFFSKKKTLIFWNKEIKRSFIYINDLVRIIDRIINRGFKNQLIINIGGTRLYKIKDVIDLISKITKIKKKIIYLDSKNNVDHEPSFVKLKKLIKNFHFTSFKNGLIKTINEL